MMLSKEKRNRMVNEIDRISQLQKKVGINTDNRLISRGNLLMAFDTIEEVVEALKVIRRHEARGTGDAVWMREQARELLKRLEEGGGSTSQPEQPPSEQTTEPT